MLSSRTGWPIPTLSPLPLCFHTQDCLFLSLILSLCLFISAILSSSLSKLHHPGSHSSHQVDFILLQIYTVLLNFKIIYPLLLFSYLVFPSLLVHCIFTVHEDVINNFEFLSSNFSFVPILDLISNFYSPSVGAMVLQLTNH